MKKKFSDRSRKIMEKQFCQAKVKNVMNKFQCIDKIHDRCLIFYRNVFMKNPKLSRKFIKGQKKKKKKTSWNMYGTLPIFLHLWKTLLPHTISFSFTFTFFQLDIYYFYKIYFIVRKTEHYGKFFGMFLYRNAKPYTRFFVDIGKLQRYRNVCKAYSISNKKKSNIILYQSEFLNILYSTLKEI